MLKQDLVALRYDLELRIDQVCSEIHNCASSITRQMYGAMLGQLALLLGLAYFFASHVQR